MVSELSLIPRSIIYGTQLHTPISTFIVRDSDKQSLMSTSSALMSSSFTEHLHDICEDLINNRIYLSDIDNAFYQEVIWRHVGNGKRFLIVTTFLYSELLLYTFYSWLQLDHSDSLPMTHLLQAQSAHSPFRLFFSWLLSFTDRDTLCLTHNP